MTMRVQDLSVALMRYFDLVPIDILRYQMDLKGCLVIRGQVAQWIVVWLADHSAVGSNPTAESICYFRFGQKH